MSSSLLTASASCTPDHVLGACENIFGLIRMGASIMAVALMVGLMIALFHALTQMQHLGRDRQPHLGLPEHHSDAEPTLAAMPIGRSDMPSSLLAGAS